MFLLGYVIGRAVENRPALLRDPEVLEVEVRRYMDATGRKPRARAIRPARVS